MWETAYLTHCMAGTARSYLVVGNTTFNYSFQWSQTLSDFKDFFFLFLMLQQIWIWSMSTDGVLIQTKLLKLENQPWPAYSCQCKPGSEDTNGLYSNLKGAYIFNQNNIFVYWQRIPTFEKKLNFKTWTTICRIYQTTAEFTNKSARTVHTHTRTIPTHLVAYGVEGILHHVALDFHYKIIWKISQKHELTNSVFSP